MVEYQGFRIGDLFDIHPTKNYGLTNEKLFKVKGETPVIVNSSLGNGVGGFVNLSPTEKGNIITFSDTTTADSIFYQPSDFIGYSHVQGVYPLQPDKWSKESLIFFVANFRKITAGRFDYATKFNRKIAIELIIRLPITNEGDIDFRYMENYICEIETARIDKLKAHLGELGFADDAITDDEQKFLFAYHEGKKAHRAFSLDELFYKKEMPHDDSRPYRSRNRDDAHNVAGVVAKHDDNGVMYWVKEGDFKFSTDQDGITVIANGAVASGRVFYQEYKYTILNDAYTIKMKNRAVIGRNLGLYLVATIEKRLFATYSWESKPTWERVKNDKIELPVNHDGDPDYDFMSNFIRIQQKLAIKKLMNGEKWRQPGKIADVEQDRD